MKILLLIPIFVFGFNFQQEYKKHEFKKICLYGANHFQEIKHNEDTLTLVGLSCVKSDYFIYLPHIINNLKHTKKARLNSIYFSILFIEKKLLISYILDNIDISYYRFPKINHPISIVINHIIKRDFKKDNGKIIIKDKNSLYKIYKNDENKIFIDIYQNNQLISSHWYR